MFKRPDAGVSANNREENRDRDAGKIALANLIDVLAGARVKALVMACETIQSRSSFYAYVDADRPNRPTSLQLHDVAQYSEAFVAEMVARIEDLKDAALIGKAPAVNTLTQDTTEFR